MADKNALMRPLTSDSLKPRPSTQAVWEPRRAEPEPLPAAQPVQEIPAPTDPEPAAVLEIEAEPVVEPVPETPAAPSPVTETEELPVQMEEPLLDAEQPEGEYEAEFPEEESSLPPYTETVFTFSPAVSAQGEEPCEEPEPEPQTDLWEPAPSQEEEEEPFDLDAVIASILADGDDEDDDEDQPSAQDALPTEEMPEPAAVPLYDDLKPRPRKKGWIWLIGAALIVTAAGWAARHFGWLN